MKKTPNPHKMKRISGPIFTEDQTRQTKIRITTYLDADLLSNLKTLAQESGGKYQTMLNQVLRDYLMGTKNGVLKRLARLEKSVFRDKRTS
jgi:uncharacterized protein (DUF4415 family)